MNRSTATYPQSAAIRCTAVVTKSDFTAFIRLPRLIYRGMKGFVPRLDLGERLALDPKKAPFFRHGTAQYWMAWRDGQPVGRISAQIDRLQSEPYGCFGCFETIDDADVVRALLYEAERWLRERGAGKVRGPFTLSINGESGLMTEGQDLGPMIMMPWHPRFLAQHLQTAGYNAVKTLLCYSLDLRGFSRRDVPGTVKMPRMPENVRVRPLNLKTLNAEAKLIADIYNSAWQDNWGFVPLAVEEVETLAHAFKPFLVPECGVVAERDGVPVAMALVLPNLETLTADFDGRLLPFNWARLLYRAMKKNYQSGRMLLFGVDKSVQGTVLGAIVPFAMLAQYARYAEDYQLQELEMSWVLEDNHAVRAMIERFGCTQTKRYTVFEKIL
jgi:GNAT superfamily N-acetyltransferase